MPLIPHSTAVFHAKYPVGAAALVPGGNFAAAAAHFPCEAAFVHAVRQSYSDSPAASRASSRVMYSQPRAIFPSRIV